MEHTVYIKERAFLAMLLSVVEVYKREALGLLLGYRGENRFFVEYAIPFQTAERKFSWAAPKAKAITKMTDIIKNMSIDVIGDYHSHTEYGEEKATPIPSGEDIADMQQGNVHIIIAVNQGLKRRKWRANTDGTISGTISHYHIRTSAATPIGDYKYKRVRIICPSATGLWTP
ncbi:Mov34/MPN/PAD-1 family protein [candidate division WOR-3 bacterium]|nr:Mov34/MPN/PAD-1 family protein [candidate division WOR-3 bacterium]